MVSGDNTHAIKTKRAYDRLLISIINDSPKEIIDGFLFEYIACDSKFKQTTKSKPFEEYEKQVLEQAKKESKKYVLHYQAARERLVKKTEPLGKILLIKQELLLRQLKKSIDDIDEPYKD